MDLKIFSETVEHSALQQIYSLKDHPAFKDEKIRIMPDVHAGSGCVIGFTSTFKDKIVPQIVGVDIGCGVDAACLRETPDPWDGALEFLDKHVRRYVPSGFGVHDKIQEFGSGLSDFIRQVEMVCERTGQENVDRVFKSLGTLGGGNHFIEADRDEQGRLWVVVHSGSRNFGLQVASHHQRIAREMHPFGELSYLEGKAMEDYIFDMQVAQEYAALNRKMILSTAAQGFTIRDGKEMVLDRVSSVHNYINFEDKIIRKGAISAHVGERVIIPFNMRDGSVIAVGKGSEDWNWSAPHGAGRLMGRSAAKKALSMDDFKTSMQGIYTTCVSESTLDEAPMAYKSKDEVLSWIQDTADNFLTLKPIYNFKAEDKRK